MNAVLNPSMRELSDILSDLRKAPFQEAPSVVQRFISVIDSQPLSGFLRSMLPPFSFAESACLDPPRETVGPRTLRWPIERNMRALIVFDRGSVQP